MEASHQNVSPNSVILKDSQGNINIDSSCKILELPVEILTYLLSYFNSEKDVLAVSTTCSIFYEIMLKENPALAFVRLRTAIPLTFFGERNLGQQLKGVSVSPHVQRIACSIRNSVCDVLHVINLQNSKALTHTLEDQGSQFYFNNKDNELYINNRRYVIKDEILQDKKADLEATDNPTQHNIISTYGKVATIGSISKDGISQQGVQIFDKDGKLLTTIVEENSDIYQNNHRSFISFTNTPNEKIVIVYEDGFNKLEGKLTYRISIYDCLTGKRDNNIALPEKPRMLDVSGERAVILYSETIEVVDFATSKSIGLEMDVIFNSCPDSYTKSSSFYRRSHKELSCDVFLDNDKVVVAGINKERLKNFLVFDPISGKHLRTIKDQDATNLSSISNDKIAIFNRSTKEDRDHELINIFSLNTAALLAAFKIPINDRLNGDRVVIVRFENVSKRTYLLVGENHGKLIVFLPSNHEKRENIL